MYKLVNSGKHLEIKLCLRILHGTAFTEAYESRPCVWRSLSFPQSFIMYALLVVASQFAKAFVRQAPINDNRMRAPVTGAENRKPAIDLITIQRSYCALLSTRFARFLYLVILLFTYFLMR